MHSAKELAVLQREFFASLAGTDAPAGVRGIFDVYRYAYVERIRESIAEDFPRLFVFLESPEIGIDSETVARALVEFAHPKSWTLAEASLPVITTVEKLLRDRGLPSRIGEARQFGALDEAESFSAWLEEWPEPRSPRAEWVAEFAEGKLRIARTKTWREGGDRVFWRGEGGVTELPLADFSDFEVFFPLVAEPVGFAEIADRAEGIANAGNLSNFIRRGIAEGWLRLT